MWFARPSRSRGSRGWNWKLRAPSPALWRCYTEADLAADGIGELPCITVIEAVEPIIVPPRPALARGFVRHVGDPVVCIDRGVAGGGDGGRRSG